MLVSTFFIVLLLGIYVVIRILIGHPEYSVQALIALFSYVGVVNGISIPFYLQKSEHENIHKNPDIQTIEQLNQTNNFDSNLDQTNSK